MKAGLALAALAAASLLLAGGAARATPVRVLLSDGFAGDFPDPDDWTYQRRDWLQGLTQFDLPPVIFAEDSDAGPIRFVRLEQHGYNPNDLPGPSFRSSEFLTKREFRRFGRWGLVFEARLRLHPMGDGRIAAFFTYGDQPDGTSDELDFEFLSNLLNDPSRKDPGCPDGQWVLTNTWNDSQQNPGYLCVPGLDLYTWNTFQMRWFRDRVEWWWLPDGGDRVLLRTAYDRVPDSPMSARVSLWACDTTDWPEGCTPGAAPADSCTEDEVDQLDVDYVEVRRVKDWLHGWRYKRWPHGGWREEGWTEERPPYSRSRHKDHGKNKKKWKWKP